MKPDQAEITVSGIKMTANTIHSADPKLLSQAPDKDNPLREDIRFLGAILGDTLREQEGQDIFDVVEAIRKASVAFHRDERKWSW